MAEEEKAEKKKDGEQEAEGAAKGGSKKKLILIVGGVVLLLLLIGTPLLIMSLGKEEKKEEMDQVAQDTAIVEDRVVVEGFGEEEEYAEDEEPMGAILPLDTFVVNLDDGGYLRCLAQLEFHDRNVPRRFYSRLVPVRDKILSLLSAKTREDIDDAKGRGKLREEMKALINATIKKDEVKYVYFTEFIIQ